MENWNSKTVNRLYQLFLEHEQQLLQAVVDANRAMGASDPTHTKLVHLSRAEFLAILRDAKQDRHIVSLWLQRIIHGHESEFPTLQVAG